VVTPERVAAAIDRVVRRPRARTGVGWANPIMVVGFTAMPGVYDALVRPLMTRFGLGRERTQPDPGNVLAARPDLEGIRGPWRGPLGLRRR